MLFDSHRLPRDNLTTTPLCKIEDLNPEGWKFPRQNVVFVVENVRTAVAKKIWGEGRRGAEVLTVMIQFGESKYQPYCGGEMGY